MNILMLGRWVPPPRRPVRATREYQFARHLARSHRLTLAFITDNPDAGGAISALRAEFGDLEFAAVPRGWKSLVSALRLATGDSCTLSYVRSEALRTRLADRLKSTPYALIFVTSSSMIRYALDIDPAIPLVVDFADLESEWWLRQAERGAFPGTRFLRTEATRLRAAEAAAASRAAACFAATDKDTATILALAPQASVTMVPNGVDVDFFGSGARPGTAPTVVVNASLEDAAEIHDVAQFCRTVLPAVRAQMPAVRFVVVGKEPLPSSWAGALLGAEVAAPVNDPRRFFHGQAVAVAPLRSGIDVRTTVLEPMAAGVPVVGTPKACEQARAGAGRDLVVADDPLDFARQVICLLENASLRRQLAERGRRFVEANGSWDCCGARVAEVIDRVLKLPGWAAAPTPRGAIGAAVNRR